MSTWSPKHRNSQEKKKEKEKAGEDRKKEEKRGKKEGERRGKGVKNKEKMKTLDILLTPKIQECSIQILQVVPEKLAGPKSLQG